MERFEVPISSETERWVEAVERGDEVILTRDGQPVVKLEPASRNEPPSPDLQALLDLRESLKALRVQDGARLIRDLRDATDH